MYTENITVNGITYKMIGEAEVTNIGAPAVAVCVWDCVRADEAPNDLGFLPMYQFRYSIPDVPEETCSEWFDLINWDAPDDIVDVLHMWDETERRMV